MNPGPKPKVRADQIAAAHRLYCELTGQQLSLGYDRERGWYELLRAGFDLADLRRLILYLQKEIRHQRRNVGALKLSNLLQPDRFEEDLALSRVRLKAPGPKPPAPKTAPPPDPEELRRARRRASEQLRELREQLGFQPKLPTSNEQIENHEANSTDSNDNPSTN